MKALLVCLSLLVASTSIAAPAKDFVEIKGGAPVTIRPDRAYLLFRTNSKETRVYIGISPVFLRIPTAEEMAMYDAAKRAAFAKAEPGLKRRREELIARKSSKAIPAVPSLENFDFVYDQIRNIYSVSLGRALEKSSDERVMLVEARAGDYVLYGWGQGEMLVTCLCLGTVSFSAEAGKITDLGTLLVAPAMDPSPIPELKDVTGLGRSMNGHVVVLASAIRPASDATPIPSALTGKPTVRADYRATGKFVSPFTFNINRLVPIAGVLGYDRGTVLDLKNKTVAEDHYY